MIAFQNFADHYMITVLEGSNFWHADENLSYQLKPSNQNPTLHIFSVFIILRKTDSRLLDALENFSPHCKLDKALLNFEMAPVKIFQKNHPISMLFPLIPKNCQEAGQIGLKKLLLEDHNFALAIK